MKQRRPSLVSVGFERSEQGALDRLRATRIMENSRPRDGAGAKYDDELSLSGSNESSHKSDQKMQAGPNDDHSVSYRDHSRAKPERPNEVTQATFPAKLYEILSNSELSDIVCWLPHGRAWRILHPKAFEEKVIPLYFRHGRYTSFTRQVNGWGFRRIMSGPDYNAYYHELFLRGLPHLCNKMKRISKTCTSPQNEKHPSAPDFYAMSRDNPLPSTEKPSARKGTPESSELPNRLPAAARQGTSEKQEGLSSRPVAAANPPSENADKQLLLEAQNQQLSSAISSLTTSGLQGPANSDLALLSLAMASPAGHSQERPAFGATLPPSALPSPQMPAPSLSLTQPSFGSTTADHSVAQFNTEIAAALAGQLAGSPGPHLQAPAAAAAGHQWHSLAQNPLDMNAAAAGLRIGGTNNPHLHPNMPSATNALAPSLAVETMAFLQQQDSRNQAIRPGTASQLMVSDPALRGMVMHAPSPASNQTEAQLLRLLNTANYQARSSAMHPVPAPAENLGQTTQASGALRSIQTGRLSQSSSSTPRAPPRTDGNEPSERKS